MCAEDANHGSFDELLRSIARELSRSVQERVTELDPEEIAEAIGLDPAQARQWLDSAGQWLREQAENVGGELPFGTLGPAERGVDRGGLIDEDPLRNAGPHPLDLPTDEQGLALAALTSGRWTIEPGSHALASHGEGPGPSDALGLVRELRVRDWVTADGEVTLVGQHALGAWLNAASTS